MSTTCTGCGSKILNLNFMECSICSKLYDLLCLNITEEQFKEFSQRHKGDWSCPSCCLHLMEDNSITLARPVATYFDETYTESANANQARGIYEDMKTCNTIVNPDMAEILSEIRYLREEVGDLKKQNSEIETLRKDLAELKQKRTISSAFNVTEQDYKNKLEDANQEIVFLKIAIVQLKRNQDVHEQNSMVNEIELVGIPEHADEDLTQIVLLTAQKLDVDLSPEDIGHVTRLGSKLRPLHMTGAKFPRPIIVKLVRRMKRDEIITASKQNRHLTTEHIVDTSPQHLYINERLTKNNRELFREARQLSREYNFRYCWVRNGVIYIRKDDNRHAIRLKSKDDLEEKLGPFQNATQSL